MKKIMEKSVAEIIVISIFLIIFLSSCGNSKQIKEKEMKDCCKKTAQEVYEYEGWTIDHAN